ncbi:hypothetical protein ACFFNY_20445 [Paenibacillus hodogayensis]|uniref:Group-specific protein n=1 Tax=Paenibacillus hodogayensis TaxID=279208 RepID=A0ABV5W043_9BACL
MKKSLPLIGLAIVFIISNFYLDDFFIRGGLNPKDAYLIPALSIGCYILGLVFSPNSKELLKKQKDNNKS